VSEPFGITPLEAAARGVACDRVRAQSGRGRGAEGRARGRFVGRDGLANKISRSSGTRLRSNCRPGRSDVRE